MVHLNKWLLAPWHGDPFFRDHPTKDIGHAKTGGVRTMLDGFALSNTCKYWLGNIGFKKDQIECLGASSFRIPVTCAKNLSYDPVLQYLQCKYAIHRNHRNTCGFQISKRLSIPWWSFGHIRFNSKVPNKANTSCRWTRHSRINGWDVGMKFGPSVGPSSNGPPGCQAAPSPGSNATLSSPSWPSFQEWNDRFTRICGHDALNYLNLFGWLGDWMNESAILCLGARCLANSLFG